MIVELITPSVGIINTEILTRTVNNKNNPYTQINTNERKSYLRKCRHTMSDRHIQFLVAYGIKSYTMLMHCQNDLKECAVAIFGLKNSFGKDNIQVFYTLK